ncbi:unnamed protein product, partial [Urochloa humidicola]
HTGGGGGLSEVWRLWACWRREAKAAGWVWSTSGLLGVVRGCDSSASLLLEEHDLERIHELRGGRDAKAAGKVDHVGARRDSSVVQCDGMIRSRARSRCEDVAVKVLDCGVELL